MNKTDDAVAGAISKLSEKLSALGPDAERIYSSLVEATVLKGSIVIVFLIVGFVASVSIFSYGISSKNENCAAGGSVVAIFIFGCMVVSSGYLLTMVLYPEAHLVLEVLRK